MPLKPENFRKSKLSKKQLPKKETNAFQYFKYAKRPIFNIRTIKRTILFICFIFSLSTLKSSFGKTDFFSFSRRLYDVIFLLHKKSKKN